VNSEGAEEEEVADVRGKKKPLYRVGARVMSNSKSITVVVRRGKRSPSAPPPVEGFRRSLYRKSHSDTFLLTLLI
jgi:hypothetical protein